MTDSFWRDRQVLLTGHTGFKGGWLALWLNDLGARVHGYSLAPPTTPNLFEAAGIERTLAGHTIGDIRDAAALTDAIRRSNAQIVIHMAAQPLVRLSYKEPVETFEVNVMGTVHVLEAVRNCPSVRAVLVITSDKCYENREWVWGYRENEALGGVDPYSSSKACTELVTAAYRASYFNAAGVAVASARAGNVIGGGDWAADRLIPDFFRAVDSGTELEVRYPDSTRPWQHVLQPLSGYIRLSAALLTNNGLAAAQAWNFGPLETDSRPVRWVLDYLSQRMPGSKWRHTGAEHAHEARSLRLDSSKAAATLGWSPRWPLETALDKTLDWHARWVSGADMQAVSLEQLRDFPTDRGT